MICWVVRHMTTLPVDEHGDSDWDWATYQESEFPTQTEARAFALKAAEASPLGIAELYQAYTVSAAELDRLVRDEDWNGDYWLDQEAPTDLGDGW